MYTATTNSPAGRAGIRSALAIRGTIFAALAAVATAGAALAAEETGATFVDTFAAGLGEMNDVHPRDKTVFADIAAKAVR